jgi:hypothetical protein
VRSWRAVLEHQHICETGSAGIGLAKRDMRQATTRTLYGYWNELRAGRLAPHRLEIEPSRIAGILCETLMLERLSAEAYRYRLAGTRLCELFGSELRGHDFLDGWSSEDRALLKRCLSAICDQGGVVVLALETGDRRRRLQLEAILLPLLYSDGITRILGAMSGAADHWLVHEPNGPLRLLHAELIWPDGRPHGLLPGCSRDAFPLQSGETPGGASARTRFRVLEGGLGGRRSD